MNYVLTPSAVQKLRRVVTPRLGGSTSPAADTSPVSVDLCPPPFTVRWAASLATPESSEGAGDATDGEWIIYLPASGILKVGTTDIDVAAALTAAGGIYPAGGYKLLDSNDDPILSRSTGGTLILNVTLGTTPSAAWSTTAGSAPVVAVKIATAAVDSTTGARTVKQFVASSLVIAASNNTDDDIKPDEITISEKHYQSSDSEWIRDGIIQIKGFGRFHPDPVQHPNKIIGAYEEAATLDLEPDQASGPSVLVRVGNVDQPDSNTLGYRKLRVKSAPPAPFRYFDNNGTPTIGNNVFYFAGALQSLSDFTAVPSTGTVYLVCTRTDPDASRGEPAVWSFALSATEGTATTGTIVVNVKLYDFVNGAVTCDYRHSFLALPQPDFDLYYGKYEFKSLSLGAGTGQAVVIGKIVGSQDATITQKVLVAGSGITLTEANDTITIAATGGSGSTSGFTGTRLTVRDNRYVASPTCQLQVKYNQETWVNGVMTATQELAWQLMEGGQAVEETV